MQIIPLAVPTPFYVGDVNVYLIKKDPLTLIDVGPKTNDAYDTLVEKLGRQGIKLADIRRVVLTHAHEDHCGLAKKVRDEAKNAEIFVHQWETGHLFGRLSRDQHHDLLLRSGVPPEVFAEMRGLYQEISLLTDALDENDYRTLEDGSELEFDGETLRVLHTPGHTPGSCSFIREGDRTLICGDCVLKRITPNPIVSPDPVDPSRRFPSLSEYLVSLARLREQKPTLTFGGHGEPINDFDEIFHRYVRSIDERQRTVQSLIPTEGTTAFEIAAKLFPTSFNQDVHRFLAISEAIAHLDHAEREGKVNVELRGGVEFYRRP
jgi:glyoxylase-like metal-dependent hydrolase (beta-lactamase superfamily II)